MRPNRTMKMSLRSALLYLPAAVGLLLLPSYVKADPDRVVGTYVRGTEIPGNNGYVGLCNCKQIFRDLGADYSPRFVTVTVCDSDTRCLGGQGTCRPTSQTMTVNLRVGNQTKEVSVSIPRGCECQVLSGSPAHSTIAR